MVFFTPLEVAASSVLLSVGEIKSLLTYFLELKANDKSVVFHVVPPSVDFNTPALGLLPPSASPVAM